MHSPLASREGFRAGTALKQAIGSPLPSWQQPMLWEVMPQAAITGFIWPAEAIEYSKLNRVMLAVLDIELGTASGLDLWPMW